MDMPFKWWAIEHQHAKVLIFLASQDGKVDFQKKQKLCSAHRHVGARIRKDMERRERHGKTRKDKVSGIWYLVVLSGNSGSACTRRSQVARQFSKGSSGTTLFQRILFHTVEKLGDSSLHTLK